MPTIKKENRIIEKRLVALISEVKPNPEAKARIWENIKQKLEEETK